MEFTGPLTQLSELDADGTATAQEEPPPQAAPAPSSSQQRKKYAPPKEWISRLKDPLRPLSSQPPQPGPSSPRPPGGISPPPPPLTPSSSSSLSIPSFSSQATPAAAAQAFPLSFSSTKPRARTTVDARPPLPLSAPRPPPPNPLSLDVPMRGSDDTAGVTTMTSLLSSAEPAPAAAPSQDMPGLLVVNYVSASKVFEAEELPLHPEGRRATGSQSSAKSAHSSFAPRRASSLKKTRSKGGGTRAADDPASSSGMSCDEDEQQQQQNKNGRMEEAGAGGAGTGGAGGSASLSTIRESPSPKRPRIDAAAPAAAAPAAIAATMPSVPPPAASRGAPRSAVRDKVILQHVLFFIRHYTGHDENYFSTTQELHAAFMRAISLPRNLIAPDSQPPPDYLRRMPVIQFGRVLSQLFDSEAARESGELSFEGVPFSFIRSHRKKNARGFKGLTPSV